MTEAEMRRIVSETFVAGWTAGAPDIPFALENEALPSADKFALLTITLTTAQQTTQGGQGTRRERSGGWVNVKIWTPANTGMVAPAAGDADGQRATDLAEIARGVFRLKTLPGQPGDEGITLQSPVTQTIGTDGRWFMQLVRTPFWYAATV